jgi:HupE / UreJ protein
MARVTSRIVLLLVSVTIPLIAAFGLASPAAAHPLNTSAVLLDLGTHQVSATIDLPLDELSIARSRQLTASNVLEASTLSELRSYVHAHLSASDDTGQAWTVQVSGGEVDQVDGADNLVLAATLTPSSGTVAAFVLHYDAVLDTLISHRVFVSARYGHTGSYTTLAMLSWQTLSVPVTSTLPSTGQGFFAAVHLGIQHISTGSDHLLFLLMLLLPAPLVAQQKRWTRRSDPGWAGARCTAWRVVHVVSAFAIGHSITLALGALGWVHLPARLVESGIALSVLVSAVHAIRPLVRGGEVFIGLGFGLLHGMAFAALLGELHLSSGGLVLTLLGFNLGIEVTQLLVVALVMPSLVLLSTTGAYPICRTALAVIGALLAGGWLAARSGLIASDPLEPIGNILVEHPFSLAGVLAIAAIAAAGKFGFQQDRSVLAGESRFAPTDQLTNPPR